MSFLDTQASSQKVGNDSGFLLEFFKIGVGGIQEPIPHLAVSSDHYHATIDATLPGGLEAGRYVITIEGLTDEDFAKLASGNENRAKVLRLYLFWREVNQSVAGYFGNLAGFTGGLSEENKPDALVAELRVLRVERKVGERVYETKIYAAERVMFQLKETPTPSHEAVTTYAEAIDLLAGAAHVETIKHLDRVPAPTGPVDGADTFTFTPADSCARSILGIAQRLEEVTGKRGRGMLLIRDGKLHIGIRPIPIGVELPPKDLSASNGLIETQLSGNEASDPFASLAESAPPGAGSAPADPTAEPATETMPVRPQYALTLKGRPDLKPGDLIRFDLSPLNEGEVMPNVGEALLGPFAGAFAAADVMENPKIAYVQSVNHKVGRAQGFVTSLVAIGCASADENDVWDVRTEAGPGSDSPDPAPASADPAIHAAHALRRLTAAPARRAGLEIGEVRMFTANASSEPTSQTSQLWCGLRGRDGRPNQARRLPISRDLPAVKEGVGYVSPFAWGKVGLILPRYPGMRIAVGYRNGDANDTLDLGGVFETSTTSTEAHPGDWWLSLPAKVPAAQRERLEPSATPAAYTDVVTNDLIDADGNRVIQVRELTITVKDLPNLPTAGTRPTRAEPDGSITIEHAKGEAKIVIKPDGEISIIGKKMIIDVGDGDIEMTAKNIKMTAETVDVSVSSEMNVHG